MSICRSSFNQRSKPSANLDDSRIGLFNSAHDVAKKSRGCDVTVDISLVISMIPSLLSQFYLFELRHWRWGMLGGASKVVADICCGIK